MCGVVALATSNPRHETSQWTRALLLESRIRGLHAFGLAWHWDDRVHVMKFQRLDEWLQRAEMTLPAATAFLAHTRYSTSGDYLDEANNQPLATGSFALSCNGTIDMGTKAEMETKWETSLHTANDAELVLQDLVSGREPQARFTQARASFAGCWLAGPKLYALRNEERPLWSWSPEPRTVLVASTADIFHRAIPSSQPTLLAPDVIHWMNPWIG